MPIDSYDHLFGAKKGSANKALAALIKEYGPQKGTRIFYAMAADRKKARKSYARPADGRK